jgi:hypothetical protein
MPLIHEFQRSEMTGLEIPTWGIPRAFTRGQKSNYVYEKMSKAKVSLWSTAETARKEKPAPERKTTRDLCLHMRAWMRIEINKQKLNKHIKGAGQ